MLQVFKDHMIDGETLPLLSEEHLLDTLGLKLGPALKVRSQVWRKRLTIGDNCVFTVIWLGIKQSPNAEVHHKDTFTVLEH